MKIIIEITENYYKACKDWHKNKMATVEQSLIANGTPYNPSGDLISRTELKKCAIPCQIHNGALTDLCVPLYQIDNAPTVELFCAYLSDGEVRQPCLEAPCKHERPQGGRVVPDTLQGWRYEERPQGEWIRKVDEVGFISYICSECGAKIEVEDCSDDKFCFKCGAKMKWGTK